jgi:hypothetical protein
MADVTTLEGRFFSRAARWKASRSRAPIRSRPVPQRYSAPAPQRYSAPAAEEWQEEVVTAEPEEVTAAPAAREEEIVEGDVLALLGRRSYMARQFSRVGRVTKRAVRGTGHVFAKAGRATGHAVAQAGRVTRRVAKRIIRGIANKMLLHGDSMLGAKAPAMTKEAAKTLILPTATAAVTASTVTAPLAPAVPVILNEVLDEVYASIQKRIKKGMSPEKAAAEVSAALEKDDDAALGAKASPALLLGIGGAALALLIFMRRR